MTGQILERHVVRMQLAIDGMLQLNWLKRFGQLRSKSIEFRLCEKKASASQ